MRVYFACPECERPRSLDVPGTSESHCAECDQMLSVPADLGRAPLTACAVCNNVQLYRKKNFPQWLGLLILTGACLAFLGFMAIHEPRWAWGVLLGSAAFDGLLYLWVGDAFVCYRCSAEYRGFPNNPEHEPYELSIGERYRQERARREQLGASVPAPSQIANPNDRNS